MDYMAPFLPEDVIVDVLWRLPPRDLAACRCVCRAWRALVDDGYMLRADLLPLKLSGIFIQPYFDSLLFFARPAPAPVVRGLGYLPDLDLCEGAYDCCNGLLLFRESVVNPAMGWWARLPPCPRRHEETDSLSNWPYLVFDPTVSPHYEVFMIPILSQKCSRAEIVGESDRRCEIELQEQAEWPPSPYVFAVFSSRTMRWEEKPFFREGEAVGTIAELLLSARINRPSAAYWRGHLYVHCQKEFFMRISLSNDKYQVIEPPEGIDACEDPDFHVGKSEKGVYCALVHDQCRLRVWFIDESCGQIKWILKHNVDLGAVLAQCKFGAQIIGPWRLQDDTCECDEGANCEIEEKHESDLHYYTYEPEEENSGCVFDKYGHYYDEYNYSWDYEEDDYYGEDEAFEWDSDNDNVMQIKDAMVKKWDDEPISFLGFHPFKEVVFLLVPSSEKGVAYHLNCSKVQDLGDLSMGDYYSEIYASFMYTPCWMGPPIENN